MKRQNTIVNGASRPKADPRTPALVGEDPDIFLSEASLTGDNSTSTPHAQFNASKSIGLPTPVHNLRRIFIPPDA